VTNLFLYQCKSRVNPWLIFAPFAHWRYPIFFFSFFKDFVVRNTVNKQNKKMQNEPNLVLSEVEWISQVTHFYNEQRTMNNQQISNEPNLHGGKITHLINEPRTINNEQCSNEPNFDKTNYEQLSNEPNF